MSNLIAIPSVGISHIDFTDGTRLSLQGSDLVVIVGPNNSGKSVTLRGIRDKARTPVSECRTVKAIGLVKNGSTENFVKWINDAAVVTNRDQPGNPVLGFRGQSLHKSQAVSEWQGTNMLGHLTQWFCHFLSADERLGICTPPSAISLSKASPIHPIHHLQRDDKLELVISGKFRKAFGSDLIVHRGSGDKVPLHVGVRPIPAEGEDRVSLSYVLRVEALPELHLQGDGMRSFSGILLAVFTGDRPIVLIDEPEAFLHPPQARLLGSTLARDASGCQTFIATHSSDFLRGVLDAESGRVKVLRIKRVGDENPVSFLDTEKIKELWGDPLLRFSNALDGLFHEGVVVCEADSDCKFYSCVLEAVGSLRGDGWRRPDIMFTHCGGKHRVPMVVRALRGAGVPINVIVDFDVLSNEQPLRSIVESFNENWDSVQQDWRLVKSTVDATRPDFKSKEAKESIQEILHRVTADQFPAEASAEIQKVLKRLSPWDKAKQIGGAMVPPGDPTQALNRLLGKLRAIGICVVGVGELESFVRSEGNHGPKWLNKVMQRDFKSDPELAEARNFVSSLGLFSDQECSK